MSEGPFAGIHVVDLSWVVAGPAIGRVLADYGATVVRIESSTRIETARMIGPFPGGRFDPQRSAAYDNANAGKLGVTLDLNCPAGQAIVRDLVCWADMMIESFTPGQMGRWGLGYEDLRALNPSLLMLSSSLMGQTGPESTVAGYGNIGAAVSGFQSVVGWPDRLPVGPYGAYTDFVAPRFGLVALLAALDRRRRTGEGCWIDLSQAETAIQFLAPQVADRAATGREVSPDGNRDAAYAPHGVFPCAGRDAWVAIVARNDAEWSRFASVIGGEAGSDDFASFAGRKRHEDRLEAIVAGWTATREAHEVEVLLQDILAVHRAAASADAVEDPQLAGRGHFIRLMRSDGTESVVEASRFCLSETPARTERAAPFLGQDSRHVLGEILGYPADRIDALEADGVLR